MAVALGWPAHVDTNLSFSAFSGRDHTYVIRFMPQFPENFQGPLIAENGTGTFTVGPGAWHANEAANSIRVGVGSVAASYPAPLVAGRWFHLALRVSVASDGLTVEPHLDGLPLGAGMAIRREPDLPRGTVRFGRRTTDSVTEPRNGQYSGFLDDIAIFAKALPTQQIQTLASRTSRLTGSEDDLMTGFNLAGADAVPKLARSVSLHGVACWVDTSPNWSSAADARLLPAVTRNTRLSD